MQKLIPGFLRQLDHYLLVHFPIIWQSRIHYVLYAVLLTNLLFLAISLLLPLGLADRDDLWTWIWTCFVLSVAYLVVWFIHAGRFNLFKQYGKRPIGDEYLNFILNFMCITLIASTMFAFPFFYIQKVKNLISTEELAQDINTLNLGSAFFPKNANEYYVQPSENGKQDEKYYLYNYDGFTKYSYNNFISLYDTTQVNNGNYYPNDLLEQSSDTYFTDPCKDTVKAFGIYCKSYTKQLFNKKRSKQEQLVLISNYLKTAEKYGAKVSNSPEYYLSKFNASDNYSFTFDNSNYMEYRFLYKVDQQMGYIMDYRSDGFFLGDEGFLRFMWYAIFYITLVFMIYRNVRKRDFVLSIVSGIVIMVVSGIFLGLSRMNSEKEVFGMYAMIYFVLVMGMLAIFIRNNHSWFNAACINLVLLALPVMPIYYYFTYIYHYGDEPIRAEIIGFALFFVLLQPLFKQAYSRLWALPES